MLPKPVKQPLTGKPIAGAPVQPHGDVIRFRVALFVAALTKWLSQATPVSMQDRPVPVLLESPAPAVPMVFGSVLKVFLWRCIFRNMG